MKKSNWVKYLVFSLCMLFSFLVGSIVTFGALTLFNSIYTNNVKIEKEVTVVDDGISEAVDKVYDSVVVVQSFRENNLIGTGTGFIYSKDEEKYYIVTNYHVIEGANMVKIVLTNNMEVNVDILNGDQFSDVAVLTYKTDKELSIAPLGESVEMKVGDTVFAIGAPLDSSVYSWSVTRGILSGKDREVRVSSKTSSQEWIMNVLQTDAAINSGNSGGPLCNSNGEVIGITNMKLVNSGVEGMGFAIPIEEAKRVVENLISGKETVKPYIGVYMIDASDTYNQSFYELNDDAYGALITGVEVNTPAERAGLLKDDIIIGINDKKVKDIASFRYELYKYDIGANISLKILRNNEEIIINVILEKAE